MLCPEIEIEVPESLIVDFASDPESPYEKALKKLNDPGWPLYGRFVNSWTGFPRKLCTRLAVTRSLGPFTELVSVLRADGSRNGS
jgi:hypothetical protein